MTETDPRQAPRFRVLLVDDDSAFIERTSRFLGSLYDLGVANDGHQALEQVGALRPDVVLLDIDLGSRPDGFEVLARIRTLENPPPVLMVTGDNTSGTVVKAIKAGAFHFVGKEHVRSELVNLINLAALHGAEATRVELLRSQVERLGGTFVVHDPVMKRVVERLERVGPAATTVLLTGETGSGKDVAARYIHACSRRATRPFVAFNCAAIAENLIESDLFGYVKGAFTGADRDREGLFRHASGGTIFLDEVGAAPESVQLKLLRVLENGEIKRVGSAETETVDVRVIAATNQDLKQAVNAGDFREDLLFRLAGYCIELPPLRQRRGDIVPLAEYFLKVHADKQGRALLEFDDRARDYLREATWQGNVRELEHVVERAVVDCRDRVVTASLLAASSELLGWPAAMAPLKLATLEFEKRYVGEVMERANHNVAEAARLAGMTLGGFKGVLRRVGGARGIED